LRSFSTGEFADSGQRYPGFAYNDALQVAKTLRVPMLYPHTGAVWRTDDGLTLTFTGPSLLLLTHTRNDINNNSLAFIVQYGNLRRDIERAWRIPCAFLGLAAASAFVGAYYHFGPRAYAFGGVAAVCILSAYAIYSQKKTMVDP